jgi:hypothetical protein
MPEPESLMLSMYVIIRDEIMALKVWELIGRAAAGIALEGVQVSTSITPMTDDDDD